MQTHLRIVGLSELALTKEELEIAPIHVGQQDHRPLSVFCAHVTDGQQVSESVKAKISCAMLEENTEASQYHVLYHFTLCV